MNSLEEADVVDLTEQWLTKLPNVSNVQRNQIIITGGVEADLLGYDSAGEIVWIVECKGSHGLNAITQGIGQAYQYVHQKALNERAHDATVLLVCPKDTEKSFNALHVPDEVKVFFVSADGNLYERVRRKQGTPTIELQLPNTFYIRDCEIGHFKDIITIIDELGRKSNGQVTVNAITDLVHRRRPKIAAAAYNHLITLRSLGALDARNRLTPKGYHLFGLIEKGNESFKREFCEYLYCFLINVMNALVLIANEKDNTLNSINCTNQEIADKICQVWGQTVRFMYDSRTISTAMRILHELGAIEYTDSKVMLRRLVHANYLPWGSLQAKLAAR